MCTTWDEIACWEGTAWFAEHRYWVMSQCDLYLILWFILAGPWRKMVEHHRTPLLRTNNNRMLLLDCTIISLIIPRPWRFATILRDVNYFLRVPNMISTIRFDNISVVGIVCTRSWVWLLMFWYLLAAWQNQSCGDVLFLGYWGITFDS